jgi:transposase
MLQITAQSKIFIATSATDGRKAINGLVATCRQQLKIEPLEGAIFVFINKAKTTLKILNYDGQGFWLCIKRLSQGKFKWWPKSQQDVASLSHRELYILMNNGNPLNNFSQDWRPLGGRL